MENRKLISQAVRYALAAGVAASVTGLPLAASAAPAPLPQPATSSSAQTLGTIEVTGSRIKRTDVETAQPVLRIDRQQIQATGLQNVGDILQRITSSGAAINTLTNNGSGGGTFIDLRYLGPGRVLVLLNGKRLVSGNLDLIPSAIIDHIEILQDGASAVYGSDAIAGVINIITRQNFNGAEASAQYGKHWTGSHRDGETQQYSFSLGTSNDHSGIFASASYYDQKAILAGERDYSKEPYHFTGNRFGSSGTANGRFVFFVPPSATTDPSGLSASNAPLNPQLAALCPTTSTFAFGSTAGGNPLNYPFCDLSLKHQLAPGQKATIGDFQVWDPARDAFNFAPLNYLQTPYQVYSLYLQGHYDFSPNLSFNTTVLYSQEYSQQLLAPSPIFIAPSSMYAAIPPADPTQPGGFQNPAASGPNAGTISNGTNPFNPFGFGLNASGGTVNGEPNNTLLVGRRFVESGFRNFQEERHVWRFTGGFQGSFNTGSILWDWDASWNYNQFDFWSSTNGLIDLPHLFEALQGCPTPFVTGATCVPTNLFGGSGGPTTMDVGTGSMTPGMTNFFNFTGQSHSTTRQRIYNADITTSNLLELPAGGLGLALGYEYRELDLFNIPDTTDQFGEESGQPFTPISVTRGGYHVNSAYIELNVPLVANVPGFYNLNLDLAERADRYSTFGNNNSGRAALKWQPIHDLLLRATWAQGFRAPTIGNLFGPTFSNFPTVGDPCDNLTPSNPFFAECRAEGVPVGFTQPNQQIRTLSGSNPGVGPESSISRTAGFVYSPSWVPGLNINADYYKIELTNEIQRIGGNAIVQLCYTSGEFCDKINGGSNGGTKPGPRDPNTHGLVNIHDVFLNIGGITTEGWDAGISYKFPSTGFGDFTASLTTTHVKSFVETLPSGTNVDLVNADSALPAGFLSTLPAYKTNIEVDWAYGNFGASILGHYVSHYTETCGSSTGQRVFSAANGFCSFPNADGANAGNKFSGARNHVGAVMLWDAQVSYDFVAANTSLTFGINNIFDKQPPRSTVAFANSFNNSLYPIDIIGRYPYLQVTARF